MIVVLLKTIPLTIMRSLVLEPGAWTWGLGPGPGAPNTEQKSVLDQLLYFRTFDRQGSRRMVIAYVVNV